MAAASAMHAVLESRLVLLADGATGTNLLQMRLAVGGWRQRKLVETIFR